MTDDKTAADFARAVRGLRRHVLSSVRRRPGPFIVLVAANLVALTWVLLLRADVFFVLWMFWLENLVIGGFNVLRMFTATSMRAAPLLGRLALTGFFAVHYGIFCLVHGIFVVALFGWDLPGGAGNDPSVFSVINLLPAAQRRAILWSIAALAASHAVSFVTNYLRGGEYKRVSIPGLMVMPYGRIIAMHTALLLGAFLAVAFRSHGAAVAALVWLKIVVDAATHAWEHGRFRAIPDAHAAATFGK